jgi:hypothetical protein
MEAYNELIRCKKAFSKYRGLDLPEWGADYEDHFNEYKELEALIYERYDSRFANTEEYLKQIGIPYIHECLKKTLRENIEKLHKEGFPIPNGEMIKYHKIALQRYKNIINDLNLPWKIDEETYTILTEPETLIDEYFHSQVAKLETNSIENELSLALDSLKQGNATACFTHTRKFTEALEKQLIKTKTVDDFKVPFANSQFYTLNQKMYQLLSDAVHHNQRTWTIDEAKFLLRMAITLNAYYEKIDSKIATQQEHFEEVPF